MLDKRFDAKLIKAIIGLGNPGPSYYKTRHSIGFRVADELANKYGVLFHATDNKECTQINHANLVGVF